MNLYVIIFSLLCILAFIIHYGLNEHFYVNFTEEQCKKWNENKGYIDANGNVYNPVSNRMDIKIDSPKYTERNDFCEKYDTIFAPYVNKSVPDYLKVLYQLLPNIIREYNTKNYDRDLFKGWKTSGKCDSRAQILFDTNEGKDIIFNPSECDLTKSCRPEDYKCSIYGGKWTPYTGDYFKTGLTTFTKANDLQIDHTVPLPNIWAFGAKDWNENIRKTYMNDRTPGHLVNMVYYLNESKGDSGPHKWLPPIGKLRYISNWISVKYRYNLKLSVHEFNTLHHMLDMYKQFIPDTPILHTEIKGSSLLKIREGKRKELMTNPNYVQKKEDFLEKYPGNIGLTCYKIYDKKEDIETEFIINDIKSKLKENNNHLYFGILRPELLDSMSEFSVCKSLLE